MATCKKGNFGNRDPRVSAGHVPSGDFAKGAALETLVGLGLRTSVDREALLESARSLTDGPPTTPLPTPPLSLLRPPPSVPRRPAPQPQLLR